MRLYVGKTFIKEVIDLDFAEADARWHYACRYGYAYEEIGMPPGYFVVIGV